MPKVFNPLVKKGFDEVSTPGGGGVNIGDPVGFGTADRMLHIDSAGNVDDDRFEVSGFNVFGLLDGEMLSPASIGVDKLALGGLDATMIGGGVTFGFIGQSTSPYTVTVTDIDTLSSYWQMAKDNLNEMQISFWGVGLAVDPYPDFFLGKNGLKLKDGATINEFSIDGTMAGYSDAAVPTEKAVVDYVTASAGTTPPGGSDKELQFNNAGVFGGVTSTYYRSSLGYTAIGIGTSSPTSPLDVRLPAGSTNLPSFNVNVQSGYSSGSSTHTAANLRITTVNNEPASFIAFQALARTPSTETNNYFITGFQGQVDVNASSGTINDISGSTVRVSNNSGAQVNNAVGIRVYSALVGGTATINQVVGLLVDDQDAGANNFAIKTGTGRVTLGGALELPITTLSANTTLDHTHHTVKADASGGSLTFALPRALLVPGRIYIIKKIDSSGNTVTLDPYLTETIDGASTQVISTQWASLTIQSDGTDWVVL